VVNNPVIQTLGAGVLGIGDSDQWVFKTFADQQPG
jgi:hypothetical protein